MMPTQPMQDDADRRTQLAADRTILRRRAHLLRLGPDRPRRARERRRRQEAPGRSDSGVGHLGGRHRPGAVQRFLLWRGDLAPGVPRTASAPARHAEDPASDPGRGQRLLGPRGAERAHQHLVRTHGRRLGRLAHRSVHWRDVFSFIR